MNDEVKVLIVGDGSEGTSKLVQLAAHSAPEVSVVSALSMGSMIQGNSGKIGYIHPQHQNRSAHRVKKSKRKQAMARQRSQREKAPGEEQEIIPTAESAGCQAAAGG